MSMSGALRPLVAAGSSAVVVAGVFAGGYALMTAGAGTAALAGEQGSGTATASETAGTPTGRPTDTHGFQVSSARNHGQQGARQRAAHANAAPETDADASHGSTVSGERNHGQQGARQRAAHAKQHHGDDHRGDKSAAGAPRHEGDG